MIRKISLLLFTFLIVGCVQTISTRDLDKKEMIPSISFEAYFFRAGMHDRSRVVFLKIPDVDVIVESNSPEIMSLTASYAEAMSFMRERRGGRTISTQVVSYKGIPIGYLLSYDQFGINMERVYVNITEESNGVVNFSAREITEFND